MYLSSHIEIDPSQDVQFERKKPTKVFGKILHLITGGLSSEQVEKETFNALSILQQINFALRGIGIDNIVRLSMNDFTFYLDEKGEEHDLQKAMDAFELKVDEIEASVFKNVVLVVEHCDDLIQYLIEIEIVRAHKVGEYPIKIKVNGFITDLGLREGETPDELKKRLEKVFESQENYATYTHRAKAQFERFSENLALQLRKAIPVDDITIDNKTKIIRPSKEVHDQNEARERFASGGGYGHDPYYYGYYGYDMFFLYSFMWAGMMHNHNIYVNDTVIVDDSGNDVMEIGEEGFNAGDGDTMNPDAEFVAPEAGDATFYSDNEYSDVMADQGVRFSDTDIDSMDADASAFDADASDGDSGGDSGCSSCSSCSSCGGCGGD